MDNNNTFRKSLIWQKSMVLVTEFELQTPIEIAYNLKFLKEENFNKLYENTKEIEHMLTSFTKKIKG